MTVESVTHEATLLPVLVLLTAGVLGIAVAHRFKLSPILGYFLAGIAIGPSGFGLIQGNGDIETLAELGVAFLLFDIGIHLSFRTLWEARRDLFGLGPAQIILTSLALFGLAYGVFGQSVNSAFLIAGGLCLSSTAVVLQTLKERKEESTPLGKSALAVLIAQDIFVVLLLTLIPALTSSNVNLPVALGVSVLKAALALGAVVVVGRFLLRPIFDWITSTRNDDMFTGL